MRQIFIIHGGSSFNSIKRYREYLTQLELSYDRMKLHKKWPQWIAESLTECDVLLPTMPNGNNAQYGEWKIYFEKMIPFFKDDVILIGHSLGGTFLAKYLHERPLKKPVRALLLVAPCYNDESLEDLGDFTISNAANINHSAHEIHIFHSNDDDIVPFSEMTKFEADLPNAKTHVFTNRGHFIDSTFPELLEILKQK
jgi:predicted alpha/beta hydrolase family esterase